MTAVKLFVRDPLEYDTHRYDDGVDCSIDLYTGEELPSMTKQAFAEECDINSIMRRYETTGTVDHINRREPAYGDFTDVKSYHEAANVVIAAEAAFADLPAKVRDRFGNDPAKLMEFLQDPANQDEAIALGLAKGPDPKADPLEVRVVEPAEPATSPQATPSKGAKATATE